MTYPYAVISRGDGDRLGGAVSTSMWMTRNLLGVALTTLIAGPATARTFVHVPLHLEPPKECFDPNLYQKEGMVEDRQARAEAAIADYVALAAKSTDVRPVFADKKYSKWLLDGVEYSTASDPWAAQVARLERIGFAVSNLDPYHYHGAWRAIASDGSTLGYYDVFVDRVAKGRGAIFVLKLVSPTANPPSVTRHCRFPRDIEDPSLRRMPWEAKRGP
jgi:hypothetical protein